MFVRLVLFGVKERLQDIAYTPSYPEPVLIYRTRLDPHSCGRYRQAHRPTRLVDVVSLQVIVEPWLTEPWPYVAVASRRAVSIDQGRRLRHGGTVFSILLNA